MGKWEVILTDIAELGRIKDGERRFRGTIHNC